MSTRQPGDSSSKTHGAWLSAMLAVSVAGGCSSTDGQRGTPTPDFGGNAGRGGTGAGSSGAAGSFGNSDGGGVGPLAGSGAVADAGGTGGSDVDAGPLSADNACGMGSAEAQLTPVNMFVMFDRSGSMNDNNKWGSASAALGAFFQSPDAAGLRVALRFFPHDDPVVGCTDDGCADLGQEQAAVACSQPRVILGELLAEPAPTDFHEGTLLQAITESAPAGFWGGGGGTPIYAALDGALRWATANKQATPDETTVVIFVTDGEPNGCDEDFNNISALASTALATSDVATYAIGLEGSSMAQMDQLAAAGGTGTGIYIGNSANAQQELLDALNSIRGQTLSCDFPMPEPTDASMAIDPTKVNVTFTPGGGMAATLGQVPDMASCNDAKAWYYDDPAAPTRIVLCPSACDLVRNTPDAQLEILLGCETACGGLEQDCGGTPPEIPPLIVD